MFVAEVAIDIRGIKWACPLCDEYVYHVRRTEDLNDSYIYLHLLERHGIDKAYITVEYNTVGYTHTRCVAWTEKDQYGRPIIIHDNSCRVANREFNPEEFLAGVRSAEFTGNNCILPVSDFNAMIRELTEAIRLTIEFVGVGMLPANPGWAWYDALVKYDPNTAAKFRQQFVAKYPAFVKPEPSTFSKPDPFEGWSPVHDCCPVCGSHVGVTEQDRTNHIEYHKSGS